MSMSHDGLTKLIEECAEVIQVAAKFQAFPDGNHPDGAGSLKLRLEDEIADVLAAISVVTLNFKLDEERMFARGEQKTRLFDSGSRK